MKKMFINSIITKLLYTAIAVCILLTPLTVKAADEFGGGRIVIDPESADNETGKRYMPGAYINYQDGHKNYVEKYSYDKNGNITKVKLYEYKYAYDKQGNKTYDEYTIDKYEYTYKYDKNGRITARCERKNGNILKREQYYYDKNGKITSVSKEDEDYYFKEHTIAEDSYHYDKNGQLKKIVKKWKRTDKKANDICDWESDSFKYKYDNKGRLTSITEVGEYNYISSREKYKYDKKDRITFVGKYEDTNTQEEKYKYDKKGNYIYKYQLRYRPDWSEPLVTEENITNEYTKKGKLYKSVVTGVNTGSAGLGEEADEEDTYEKIITYDKYGNVANEKTKYYSMEGVLKFESSKVCQYTYDKNKNFVSSKCTTSIVNYTYDSNYKYETSERFKNYKLVGK